MKTNKAFVVLLLLVLTIFTGCSSIPSTHPDFDFSYHLMEKKDASQYSLIVMVEAINNSSNLDYTGNILDLFGRAQLYSSSLNSDLLSFEMPISPDATKKTWENGEKCNKEYLFVIESPLPEGSYELRFSLYGKSYIVPIELKYPIEKKG